MSIIKEQSAKALGKKERNMNTKFSVFLLSVIMSACGEGSRPCPYEDEPVEPIVEVSCYRKSVNEHYVCQNTGNGKDIVKHKPVVEDDEPVVDEPVVDEPVVDVDEPVVDEPVVDVVEPDFPELEGDFLAKCLELSVTRTFFSKKENTTVNATVFYSKYAASQHNEPCQKTIRVFDTLNVSHMYISVIAPISQDCAQRFVSEHRCSYDSTPQTWNCTENHTSHVICDTGAGKSWWILDQDDYYKFPYN